MSMTLAGMLIGFQCLLATFICSTMGTLSDYLIKSCCSVRQTRVFVMFICVAGTIIGIVTPYFITSNNVAVIVYGTGLSFLTLAAASYGVMYSDISPHYSSIIFPICSAIANTPGVFIPAIVGLMLEGEGGSHDSTKDLTPMEVSQDSVENWQNVFYNFTFAMLISYTIFAFLMEAKPIQSLN